MERINNRYKRDMKQTAIEWFIEQLENHNGVTRSGFEKCIQQAKEMEKEQKIKFAEHCLDKALDLDIRTAFSNVEQYYNQTFKSK